MVFLRRKYPPEVFRAKWFQPILPAYSSFQMDTKQITRCSFPGIKATPKKIPDSGNHIIGMAKELKKIPALAFSDEKTVIVLKSLNFPFACLVRCEVFI